MSALAPESGLTNDAAQRCTCPCVKRLISLKQPLAHGTSPRTRCSSLLCRDMCARDYSIMTMRATCGPFLGTYKLSSPFLQFIPRHPTVLPLHQFIPSPAPVMTSLPSSLIRIGSTLSRRHLNSFFTVSSSTSIVYTRLQASLKNAFPFLQNFLLFRPCRSGHLCPPQQATLQRGTPQLSTSF